MMKKAVRFAAAALLLILLLPAAGAEDETEYTAPPLLAELNYTSDRLFSFYARAVLYGRPLTAALSARRYLTEREKQVYDLVAGEVARVASGERLSTEIYFTFSDQPTGLTEQELGISFYNEAGEPDWSGIGQAVTDYFEYDPERVLAALFRDHPYEFYWMSNHDKNKKYSSPGSGMSLRLVPDETGEEHRVLTVKNVYGFSFPVDELYRGKSLYEADPAMTGLVTAALEHSEEIIRAAEGRSDLQRLRYYAKTLAAESAYNTEAAYAGIDYGSSAPWQLIWALDGDPGTLVVCEGYSEAFQYLCDCTEFFDLKIRVYCVQGYMDHPSVGHEWNVVHTRSGNYLADVTNACFDDVNGDTAFFETPSGGSVTAGYRVAGSLYVYQDDAFSFSDLELTFTPYLEPARHTLSVSLIPGEALPLMLDGVTAPALSMSGEDFDVRVSAGKVLSYDGESFTALSEGTARAVLAGEKDITVLTVSVSESLPMLTLPRSLSRVCPEAFSGAPAARLVLPPSLTEAEADAFLGMDALRAVIVSSASQAELFSRAQELLFFCSDSDTALALLDGGFSALYLR